MQTSVGSVLKMVVALGISFLLVGCEFDPKAHVHSQTQPPYEEHYGVNWIAEKVGGTADEWVFAPESVLTAARRLQWRDEVPIDIYVNGKLWRLKKNGDIISDEGPLDPPSDGPDGWTVTGWLLAFAASFFLCYQTFVSRKDMDLQRHAAQVDREKLDQTCRELEGRERQLAKEKRDFEASTANAIEQAVNAAREAANQRYRASLPAGTLEERDARLKEALLVHNHNGRVLTVNAISSPTGFTALEWTVNPSRPQALTVCCMRDDKTVFKEYAFTGMHKDILERGREYTFRFRAFDGSREVEDFLFVFQVPTPEQWHRRISYGTLVNEVVDNEKQLKERIGEITAEAKLFQKARDEAHAGIDASSDPPLTKQKLKARVDTELEEEREKHERRRKRKGPG